MLPIHTGINTKASVIASIYFAHYGSKHRHILLVSRFILTGFIVLQVFFPKVIFDNISKIPKMSFFALSPDVNLIHAGVKTYQKGSEKFY